MILLASSVAGFFWGKSSRPALQDLVATATPSLDFEPSTAIDLDLTETATADDLSSDDLPAVPDSPGHLSAKSALIAFLDAPDWKTRSAYVLVPEDVMPAMEAHAKQHGDGPIKTTSIRLTEVNGVNTFFHVTTPQMPEGVPVSVIGTDEGPMIDWESFIGFHDDHFRKFLAGPAEAHAILDLLVKPGDEQGHFVRYQLSVPMPDRTSDAYIRKDSVASARLRGVFEGSGGYDKATVDRLVAGKGFPLVLALVKRETNDGRSFIEIEDFVAVGWGPPIP